MHNGRQSRKVEGHRHCCSAEVKEQQPKNCVYSFCVSKRSRSSNSVVPPPLSLKYSYRLVALNHASLPRSHCEQLESVLCLREVLKWVLRPAPTVKCFASIQVILTN